MIQYNRLLSSGAVLVSVLASGLRAQELRHARRTLSFDIAITADSLFPLFGPAREAEWARGWKPSFIFPTDGSQTAEGAVFTTGDSAKRDYWVMNEYDSAARRLRYVSVRPAKMAIQLLIVVSPAGRDSAHVDVTYTHTALSPDKNADVDAFANNVELLREHWRTAIAEALARRRSGR